MTEIRCARCHRQITQASVTAGGMIFGPQCARIMNLTQKVQRTTKTQYRAFKRGFENEQQIQLFEVMAT